MIEFLQNYGLWLVLAGVFFAMHRFGMGCCGGGYRDEKRRAQGISSGEGSKVGKPPGETQKSETGCH